MARTKGTVKMIGDKRSATMRGLRILILSVNAILVAIGVLVYFKPEPGPLSALAVVMLCVWRLIYNDRKADERAAAKHRILADERAQLSVVMQFASGETQSIEPYVRARVSLLNSGESLLAAVSAELWQRRHTGYRIDSVTRELSVEKSDGLGTLAVGASASATKGFASAVDEFAAVDSGSLAVTTARLLFIGDQRVLEILLRSILDVQHSGTFLDIAHPARSHGERFIVQHADLLGPIVARMVTHARRQRT